MIKRVNWNIINFIAYILIVGVMSYAVSMIDEEGKFTIILMVVTSIMIIIPAFFMGYKIEKYKKELDFANNLLNEGQYIDALLQYAKYKGNDIFAIYNSGLCLENLKCYEEAISYFDDFIFKDSSYVNPYFRKSICLEHLKQYNSSLQQIENCIRLDNKNHIYYYQKGRLLNQLDKKQDAIKSFEDGINLDIENNEITFNILFMLYSLYKDIDDESNVLRICEQAIQKFPHRQKFYIYKSLLLSQNIANQDKLQLGFDILLLGLENNPIENREIYDQIIMYRMRLLGNNVKFNELYTNYKNLFKEFPDNYYYGLWGDVLYNLKKYDEALAKYSLVDIHKVQSSIYFAVLLQTIHCCMNLGDFNEMLIKCNEGLLMYEGNNELLIFKMIALNNIGEYDEALSVSNLIDFSTHQDSSYIKLDCLYKLERYQEVIDNIDIGNEQNIDILNMKGLSYKHLKKYDEALKIFDDILQKNEKSFKTSINKGSLLFEQKKYKESLIELNYVISTIDSSEKDYGYLLGMTYLSFAIVYLVGYSDLDKVFDNLERAIQCDDEVKQKMINDKDFDSIRDDERYRQLLQISN